MRRLFVTFVICSVAVSKVFAGEALPDEKDRGVSRSQGVFDPKTTNVIIEDRLVLTNAAGHQVPTEAAPMNVIPGEKIRIVSQSQFLINPNTTNVFDMLVLKNMDEQQVSTQHASQRIVVALRQYCRVIMPEWETDVLSGRDAVMAVIGYTAMITNKMDPYGKAVWVPFPPVPPWLVSMQLKDFVRVTSPDRASLMEMTIRVAEALGLQVGVLEDGTIIMGRRGSWVPGYVPVYTVDLAIPKQPGPGRQDQ